MYGVTRTTTGEFATRPPDPHPPLLEVLEVPVILSSCRSWDRTTCRKLLVYQEQFLKADQDNRMVVHLSRGADGAEVYIRSFMSPGSAVRAARSGMLLPVCVPDGTRTSCSAPIAATVRACPACCSPWRSQLSPWLPRHLSFLVIVGSLVYTELARGS